MKIQAVRIDGFKNLSNVKINFDAITALVALNNFGKSNVLSGIDFGIAFMKASSEHKKMMMSNSNLIPINQRMMSRNYQFECEVVTEIDDKEYRVLYGYEFTWWYSEEKQPEIVREFLKIKPNVKGQKYTQLIERIEDDVFYRSSETGRCTTKLNVDSIELIINKLASNDDWYYAAIAKKLNGMKIYMENNLDVKSFYVPDPFILKGLEHEMVSASNLPRVIYSLKKEHPDKFALLKDVFVQLFPNIQDLVVESIKMNPKGDKLPENIPFVISNTIYMLFVKDSNLANLVDFSMMSDGAKRVFMILTKIIVSNVSNVALIAIEEPENSVHPSLFHAYIQIINQLLDDCKVIITSHSPYVVSYLDPAWIHVGMSRVPGIAEFFGFKKTGIKQLERDAASFKMSMGDYLFSLLADSDSNLDDYLECDADE